MILSGSGRKEREEIYRKDEILDMDMIKNRMKKMKPRNFLLIGFIALLWIILTVLSPYFIKISNLLLLLQQSSIVMVAGIGMTFVILTGGIDLSIGSVAALSSVTLGIAITKWEWGVLPALLAGMLTGAVFGMFNGVLISYFKLQPMVCTLGVMSIARGLTYIFTSGRSMFVTDRLLIRIGNGRIGGIPIIVLIAVVLFGIGYMILNYTYFGRSIYALGGNEEATRLSGIDTRKVKTLTYAFCGFCAGVVGILYVCTLGASEPTVGQGLELNATAVTAIGGTSLLGGIGSLVGTVFGAVLIGTINNGLSILNIVSYYQQLLLGVVIILAVLLERFKKK